MNVKLENYGKKQKNTGMNIQNTTIKESNIQQKLLDYLMKVWNVKLEEMEIMEETIIIVAINAINVIVTAVVNKKIN